MRIIELVLGDEQDEIGVEAISIVENPAIESDFIALKNQEIKLAEISKEKRLLMGALLIPDKPIYAVKVNNEDVWQEYVKTKKVKGFSIEGYFADKMEMKDSAKNEMSKDDLLLNEIKNILTSK